MDKTDEKKMQKQEAKDIFLENGGVLLQPEDGLDDDELTPV